MRISPKKIAPKTIPVTALLLYLHKLYGSSFIRRRHSVPRMIANIAVMIPKNDNKNERIPKTKLRVDLFATYRSVSNLSVGEYLLFPEKLSLLFGL